MQNDLISRSALIEEFKELSAIEWNKKAAPVSWADAYESFIDTLEEAPAVDAVDRQKLIGILFPLGVPLTREDWNYSINAKAVYEAIMRTEG